MSEQKASPRLAEGASRFDRIIREVKDGQIAQTQTNAPAPAGVSPAFIPSPDEVWARQYMTVGIGPVADLRTMPGIRKEEPQIVPAEPVMEAPVPVSSGGTFAPTLPSALEKDRLGAHIGREQPRRSRTWLGRLFTGR